MQILKIPIDSNKKETTRHGSFDFPLAIYDTRINVNLLGFIDWHWHEALQFSVVTEGCVAFLINNETVLVSEGEAIFINKNALHKAMNYKNNDSVYYCVDLYDNLISGFPGSRIRSKYISPYVDDSGIDYCHLKPSIPWQASILQEMNTLYGLYFEEALGYELKIVSKVQDIWHTLLMNHFTQQASTNHKNNSKKWLRDSIDYIHKHYGEKITLEQMATVGTLSKSAFCRKFKQYMGSSVFEYILNHRLSMASQLLLTTNTSVAEIAYQCGFGSTSYFIDKFKKMASVSPLQYRKMHVE